MKSTLLHINVYKGKIEVINLLFLVLNKYGNYRIITKELLIYASNIKT